MSHPEDKGGKKEKGNVIEKDELARFPRESGNRSSDAPEQGLTTFFYKKPDKKCSRLCGPFSFYLNYSTLSL